ncbi:hypothetical protein [Adhaeribacter aquaticus]|uniref:hypothetical protein n=1 Tax=Adhaeribacter aquaticus TaxID=299567 RepID=UPI000479A63B|nr:hypothetical protein [Adhaeribacter aquaticus]
MIKQISLLFLLLVLSKVGADKRDTDAKELQVSLTVELENQVWQIPAANWLQEKKEALLPNVAQARFPKKELPAEKDNTTLEASYTQKLFKLN